MIEAARTAVAEASRIVVMTGAGVSAESGVPTFRGEQGLWRKYRPEELATPGAFARDPATVWAWYGWRRQLIGECRPNSAHHALVRLMRWKRETTLVTQNVDDLHERAALEASEPGCEPVRLHGSIFRVRCTRCGRERAHSEEIVDGPLESLPHCPRCSGLERPAVVWFGEMLPRESLVAALEAAAAADLCLVVGTSGVVYPAASVIETAMAERATLVVVDPGATAFDGAATIRVTSPAAEALPQIIP